MCRRDIASYRNDNNHTFTVEEHGCKEQCQETPVPVGPKFLVGIIRLGDHPRRKLLPKHRQHPAFPNLPSSILQRKRQMPIAQRHPCRYTLNTTFIQGSGVAKWWMSYSAVNCKLLLYADDSALIAPRKDVKEIELKLTKELESISNWLTDNKLSLHLGKTEYILFGTQEKTAEYVIPTECYL